MTIRKSLLLSLFLIVPHMAQAQTVFMVQLGTYESEQLARSQWNELSENFPNVFDTLEYAPNEVLLRPDNFVSYRTQAGPIATRDEAQEICSRLNAEDYECFVAETAMFYSDDQEVVTSAVQRPAPVAEPAAVPLVAAPAAIAAQPRAVAPAPVKAPVATAQRGLPAGYVPSVAATPANPVTAPQPLVTTTNTTQIVQPALPVTSVPSTQAVPSSGGTVTVEEAIPVPLTDATGANPYLERGNTLMTAHPSNSARVSSFWADIGYFRTEASAVQYVQLLKRRDGMLPPKLRVRVTRPYQNTRGQQRFSLRLGPFITTRPVRRLCALTRPENLRCRAVKDLGASVRNTGRYGLRINPATQRNTPSGNNAASRMTQQRAANASTGTYYVQLGSFLSPTAAHRKWVRLQASHRSLLSRAQKSITTPRANSSRQKLYRLRTGPFTDYNAASQLCNQLKTQGSLCIIVKQ